MSAAREYLTADPGALVSEAVGSMGETMLMEMRDSMRADFEIRFRESIETAARQFNEKLEETVAKFEAERVELYREVSESRKRASEIAAELIAVQAQLDHLNRETAAMLEDPNSELAAIMRHKSQMIELSAYLKGVQYLSAPPDSK